MTVQIQEVKSSLAKLLATENLTVEHANVETAYFDVENRVLVCPQYKDMTEDMYDLFIGHEVSHALYTPTDGYKSCADMGGNFKTFVNVVEDARVERMIQKKYPGLRKCFYTAYGQLKSRDFFGIADKDVDAMLFIDRLNLKAKLGSQIDIEFNDVETAFFNRSMTTTTFEEVVALSKEIFEYCQQEIEQKKQDQEEMVEQYMQSSETEETDESSEKTESGMPEASDEDMNHLFGDQSSSENSEPEGDESETSESTESSEEDNEISSEMNPTGSAPTAERETEIEQKASDVEGLAPGVKALTDRAIESAMRDMVERDTTKLTQYIYLPKKLNLEKIVVPYTKIQQEIFADWNNPRSAEVMLAIAKSFRDDNAKVISYLQKEFEMKKAAEQYARASESKTGVINTNKLFSYKYNENIFKKAVNLPNGKNHGMVFFLDWSGSMSDNLQGTIEQLINLVMFCRKVNIPFSVYAFTSEYHKFGEFTGVQDAIVNDAELDAFNLLEFFSDKMSTQEFNISVGMLLSIAYMFNRKYHGKFRGVRSLGVPRRYYLGGTPLDATIITARQILREFRARTKVEILNAIFLTDGSSHGIGGTYQYREDYTGNKSLRSVYDSLYGKNIVVRDRLTNAQIQITKDRANREGPTMTKAYYQLLKNSCDNLVGFFIANGRDVDYAFTTFVNDKEFTDRYDYANAIREFKSKFTKERYVVSKTSGLDELYIIKGGKALEIVREDLSGVDANASKGALTSAFKKMTKGKLQNRVILNKFIEKVSKAA